MSKLVALFVSLMFVAGGAVAWAASDPPPAVTWTHEFDFSDDPTGPFTSLGGTQYKGGWYFQKAGSADGQYIPVGTDVTLPDGGLSGAGNGTVYLPDKSICFIDVVNLTGKPSLTSVKKFVLQADIYVPNLYPLSGFSNHAVPTNSLSSAGIQAVNDYSPGKAVYFEGKRDPFSVLAKDQPVANAINGNLEMWLRVTNSVRIAMLDGLYIDGFGTTTLTPATDPTAWFDQWITLRIDYCWSDPNQVTFWAWIPWDSHEGDPTQVQFGTSPYVGGWRKIGQETYYEPGAAGLVQGVTGLTWDDANKRLSGASLTSYTWQDGDAIKIFNVYYSATTPPAGVCLNNAVYYITGKPTADTIQLSADSDINGSAYGSITAGVVSGEIRRIKTSSSQNWIKFGLGGLYSWTQGQWDNVKIAVPPACNPLPMDGDNDGDVDLVDFGFFSGCFNGPNRPWLASGIQSVCLCNDLDTDGDVDLADFSKFQKCFNGPNRPKGSACDY